MKTLLCISPCCGKGVTIAKKFITELALKGIVYTYAQSTPRQSRKILDKLGMSLKDHKYNFPNVAYIYVDDLMFKANDLLTKSYKKSVIAQLEIINKADKADNTEEEK